MYFPNKINIIYTLFKFYENLCSIVIETNIKHKEKLLLQGYKTFQACRNVNLSFFMMVAPK